jgi:hypothetical protein
MLHWLEREVNPYRVVVLLEPESTLNKQGSVFGKIILTRMALDIIMVIGGKQLFFWLFHLLW